MISPLLAKRLEKAAETPSSFFVEVDADDVVAACVVDSADPILVQLRESCKGVVPSRKEARDQPSRRVWVGVDRLLHLLKRIKEVQGG